MEPSEKTDVETDVGEGESPDTKLIDAELPGIGVRDDCLPDNGVTEN